MKLYIKNMVCPRCISAVSNIVEQLHLDVLDIRLGELLLNKVPNEASLKLLEQGLKDQGFELLNDNQKQLIDRIKTLVIEHVHYGGDSNSNFSEKLSSVLHRDYSSLSKLFSTTQGYTIEHYIILQKTERVKELLSYNQKTLSEIANDMQYSSTAHLSAQFKKMTGFTPTQFKKQNIKLRQGLDEVGT